MPLRVCRGCMSAPARPECSRPRTWPISCAKVVSKSKVSGVPSVENCVAGLTATSPSLIAPDEASKKTRARPVCPGLVNVTPLVGETVMRLTPSCCTRVSVEVVMLKLMLPASAQRWSARRAAPTTSLPALMFAGGELSEEERAMVMVVVGQRNWTVAVLLSCSV